MSNNALEGVPMERALRDLVRVIATLKQRLAPYFDGVDTSKQLEMELGSYRRVLLFQVNALLDVHGPNPGGGGMTRAGLAMDILTEDLKLFGIIRTEDGQMFTYEKIEEVESGD